MVAADVQPILSAIRARSSGTVSYCDGNNTQQVAALAAKADVAVVVVGSTSSEGADRSSTSLPLHHLAYLEAAAKVQQNIINPMTVSDS